MISPNASNWVDRGQAPEPELTRVLAHYLDLDPVTDGERLRPDVLSIRGMIDADSTEVQLAGYLHQLEERLGVADRSASRRRGAAITLWHIAKCAEVRDRAVHLIERLKTRAAT